MSTYSSVALRCFEENKGLFGNAQSQPEKFNLYNGLSNLAKAIQQIERDLATMQEDIQRIRRSTSN